MPQEGTLQKNNHLNRNSIRILQKTLMRTFFFLFTNYLRKNISKATLPFFLIFHLINAVTRPMTRLRLNNRWHDRGIGVIFNSYKFLTKVWWKYWWKRSVVTTLMKCPKKGNKNNIIRNTKSLQYSQRELSRCFSSCGKMLLANLINYPAWLYSLLTQYQ